MNPSAPVIRIVLPSSFMGAPSVEYPESFARSPAAEGGHCVHRPANRDWVRRQPVVTTRNAGAQQSWRRPAMTLLAGVILLTTEVAASGAPTEASLRDALHRAWQPALGGAGTQVLDRLVTRSTPPCVEPESVADLAREIRELRSLMLSRLSVDLDATVRSAKVQQSHRRDGYRIEVVRLETLERLFLPVNVYLPDPTPDRPVPLVISPTGCGSATWSNHVQKRAANLALSGIAVLVAEGFCDNGSRAADPKAAHLDYARQLIGLPGFPFGVFLQELVSSITWAVETYEELDPERIGAAGYSYGGQVALYLAQIDRRVQSVSIPATYLGSDCAGFRLNTDVDVGLRDPDFVWSAPPELPVLPVNWRLMMLYPRSLHTISGAADAGAPPEVIGPAMDYAASLYALGSHTDRLQIATDGGDHHYGRARREGSYRWLAHMLLDEPLRPRHERPVDLLAQRDLAVDISGTRSPEEKLVQTIAMQRRTRISGRQRALDIESRVHSAMAQLFPSFDPEPVRVEQTWRIEHAGVTVEGRAIRSSAVDFPCFVFRSARGDRGRVLLYLPERGTLDELDEILVKLDDYETVVSVDYPGVGETRSDRVMLHSVARYFMHSDPSLAKRIVELLRSWLVAHGPPRMDLRARGWASSMIGLMLTVLEPERIGDVVVEQVPADELSRLASVSKLPDLLLWGGLFSRVTVYELAAALEPERRVTRVPSDAVAGE